MSESPVRAILILAGGAGTRLWPLSTDENPKQFLQIFEGKSLLQRTWDRVVKLSSTDRVFVSTNDRYAGKVAEQLPRIRPENILIEPSRRNTAPAIATCCSIMADRIGNPLIGVFPSDHFIGNEKTFIEVVDRAFRFAESGEFLLTIGITPGEASTGFGYLELGQELTEGVVRVKRFVEKPDRASAETFVASGDFLWNGGMFIWRSDLFLRRLSETAPVIAEESRRFVAAARVEDARSIYDAMPAISIDYALMERATDVAAVGGDFDWSDVGSWSAVASRLGGGGLSGVYLEDSAGVFVLSSPDKPVAVVGLSNIAVIDSPDGLLVLNLDKAELMSRVVKRIKE